MSSFVLAADVSKGRQLRVHQFVAQHRAPLVMASALIMAQTLVDLAAPWPLKVAVDNIIGGEPLGGWMSGFDRLSTPVQTFIVAAAGITLVAVSGVVSYFASYLVGTASERMSADMRSAVFGRLQHQSVRFHERHRTGDLVARLTSDVSRVQESLIAWFQTFLPQSLSLLGMLVVLLVLDPPMALAAVAVVPILAIQIAVSRSRIRRAARDVRERHGRLAARATDVLRHVRAVQAFGRQEEEERTFQQESAAAAQSSVLALTIHARYGPIADVILAAGSGLVLVIGVMRVSAGDMTIGTLLVVLTYLSSLYHPIRSLTRLTSTMAKSAASRERLMEVFVDDETVPEDPKPVPAPRGPCTLALDNVTFGYRPGMPVLANTSLHINAGEVVCIVGPTGAGKSTVLSLLLRFCDPDEGRVAMDGIDIKRLALRSLRERLALVPQDTWILDGTIADNIRFGRSDATDEEVRTAAQVALVDEFAESLPSGYDTVVGESGARLSGGQRKRIALARAFIRHASIFLLDEPTSGLDLHSEARVIDAIRRVARDRTVVMVSHRLKLAAIADRVVLLDSGRIVEQGSARVLLQAGGPFARVWAEHALSLQDATRVDVA